MRKLKAKLEGYVRAEVLPRLDQALDWVWAPVEHLPLPLRILKRTLQSLQILISGFLEKRVGVHASALTYTTLLSVLPLIAVVLALTQWVGLWSTGAVKLRVTETLDSYIPGIDRILNMVEEANFGSIGIVGSVVLLGTVISMMGRVELAFNEIWEVRTLRPFWKKWSAYLLFLLIITVTLGVAWTLLIFSNEYIAGLLPLLGAGAVLPAVNRFGVWLLISLGFALILNLMPNTRVPWRSAFAAGLFGGGAYMLVTWGYFGLQIGVARFNLLYSSLAAIPITIIWVNLSWLIVLISARLCFVITHLRTYRRQTLSSRLSPAFQEESALRLALAVAAESRRQADSRVDPGWLSYRLRLPLHVVFRLANDLEDAGILQGERVNGFYMDRERQRQVRLGAVLSAVRHPPDAKTPPPANSLDRVAAGYLTRLHELRDNDPTNETLEEILSRLEPPDPD